MPYQLARQQVDVRLSAATVEVFHHSRRVASHVRSHVRHGHTTDPAHMPESHRQHAQWTPQRITGWAAKTGPATRTWSRRSSLRGRIPNRATGPRWASSAWPPLGPERAEAACARALRLRAYSYRSVESILRTGLDRQPLPGDSPALPPHPAHVNVRGPDYYH